MSKSFIKRISYFFGPYFIEKRSIVRSIKYFVEKYPENFRGKILDIGCGSEPYKDLFPSLKYLGIDFKKYSKNKTFKENSPDFYFFENYPKDFIINNIKSQSFDAVVSFQVLEHHKKPEIFFKEVSRILKKDGALLLVTPFIWPLHEKPNDFLRYTEYKIRDYCLNHSLKIIETQKRGGPFSTVVQLINLSILDSKIWRLVQITLLIMILPLRCLSLIGDLFGSKGNIFLGYSFLIKKD